MSGRKRKLFRGLAGGVACLLAGAGLLMATPSAFAATAVTGRGPALHYEEGVVQDWMGTYEGTLADGTHVLLICLDPSKPNPIGENLSDPFPLTSFENDEGETMSASQLAEVSYLIANYGVSSDAEGAAMQLAISTVLGYDHVKLAFSNGSLTQNYYSFDVTDPGSLGSQAAADFGISDLVTSMVDAARANYSTWDGVTRTVTTNTHPGMQPGETFQMDVTLPGLPAGVKFILSEDTLGDVASGLSDANGHVQLSWTIPQTPGAEYGFHARMDGSVSAAVPLAATSGGGSQSMLLLLPQTVTWNDPEQFDLDVVSPPTITTQISAQVVSPGATVSDTVKLAGLVSDPDISYSVSGTLVSVPALPDWTCPAASATAWKSAKTVLTVPATSVAAGAIGSDGTATLSKLGSWTVPLDVETQCISYGETVVMKITGQADTTVDHPSGQTPQTGLVVAAPKIETTVSNQAVVPGTTVSDRVTLSGLVSNKNVTYTVSGVLLSTPPLVDGTCPNIADAVWGDAVTTLLEIPETTLPADAINKDGTATLDPFGAWVVPLDAPTQCISYGEDLFMKITGQPTIKVEHPAGETLQTGLVTKIEVQAAGIEVQAGGQVTSPAGFGLWGVAGCLLTAGMGGAVILRRRRVTG